VSNYRRGGDSNDPQFKASTVICPDLAVIPVRGDQETRVVHDDYAERCLPESRISSATRSRVDRSSASVSWPFSSSHSVIAAKPSRNRSARRAAAVIHAETLTPSSAAAATTRWWTSESTVIVSFGEGSPLGMEQVHDRGGRVVGGGTAHHCVQPASWQVVQDVRDVGLSSASGRASVSAVRPFLYAVTLLF
jgi:hypothetical protein